jgi:hypothetical protein
MRTTLTLPDDLLQVAHAIARDRRQTLSQVIADLARRGLRGAEESGVAVDPETGLPLVRLGRTVTSDDVRSLEDE